MTLSPRLMAAVDYIAPGARVADVGTDHGYLPIWLLQNGIVRAAIASDLREGPLACARENARKNGVENRICFRLCDGLEGIAPDETDTIVIAGMGGETIRAILDAAPWTGDGAHTLILQPMTKTGVLREYLFLSGYRITAERLVRDDGRLYVLLCAVGGGDSQPRSRGVYLAGDPVLKREDPLQNEYLDEHICRLRHALAGAQRSERQEDFLRRRHMTEALTELTAWRKGLE